MSFSKIIIEGPDCAGKSTVVERIKNVLHWDSKSLHHKEGDQFNRYLIEYSSNNLIVFDRSHFSEVVYSKIWRGGNPFSERELNILNELCKLKCLLIFVCPSVKIIQERYNLRKFKQQIKFNELQYSKELFCELFDDIPHILYTSRDYEELDELTKKVVELIK